MRGFYVAMGGGSGDVWWTALEDSRMTLLAALKEDYGHHIRVYSITHCPGTEDIFRYQSCVDEVLTEQWRLPNEEDARRFSRPIDDLIPLTDFTAAQYASSNLRRVPFNLRYSPEEEAHADELLSRRPCIVLQPYAGLSDRDGFDPERLGRLCDRLVTLDQNCQVLVLGLNHERGHKYTQEVCEFEHPRVINLIDQLNLRMSILLTSRCDAYAGAHSNLIRAAWRWRRRNACVMPRPSMTDALPGLDPQYRFGFSYPETKAFTYFFDNKRPRDFSVLDIEGIALHLLGR